MSMSFEICSFTPYMLRRNKIEFDLPESSQGKLRLIDNTLNQQLVQRWLVYPETTVVFGHLLLKL